MKTISRFLFRFVQCSISLCALIIFHFHQPLQAMEAGLAEEWGWFPERAGLIAAESWGIKPQWHGKTIVESFLLSPPAPQVFLASSLRQDLSSGETTDLPDPSSMPQIPAGFTEILGEVSDEKLDPVVGAVVEILGTGKTVETKADGSFSFPAIASGNLTIEASKLGYASDTQSATAIPGQKLTIRMMLKKKAADVADEETMLEEEVVVGEYQENSTTNFNLDMATTSINISSGLSKEDFSRAGVSDAGEAVSKIAGANIVDGRYAVVRGLGDRYSNTLFNGALIPSADPSKKAVQLDLFPSKLLESVAITKLFSPELPAEFAGGTVQIQTLSMPKERIMQFSYGVQWFERTAGGEFMGDPTTNIGSNNMDFSQLPAGFDQPNNFTGSVLDSLKMHLSAPMRPSSVNDDIAQSMSLTLGDTFELADGVRLGTIFGLTQSNQNVYQDIALGRGYQFDNFTTPEINDPVLNNTRRNESFARELNFGAMANINLELGGRHDISFNYFTNDSFADNYTRTSDSFSLINGLIFSANPRGDVDPNTGEIVRAFATPLGGADFFEPLERSLESKQLKGSHVLYGDKERGGTFSWMVSDATSTEGRPHSRTYSFTELDFADAERIPGAISDPSQYRPEFGSYTGAGDPVLISGFPSVNVFRETLKTVDEGDNKRADVYLPFYFDDASDDRVGIRLGYNTNDRSREVRGRFYTYDFTRINDQLMLENSLGQYQSNYGQLFHDLFNSGLYPFTSRPFFGNQGIIINDFSGNGTTIRNIDAGSAIDAYYFGSEAVAGGWTIAGGLRLERENRYYQILPGLNPSLIANDQPVEFDIDTILPGASVTKAIGKDDKHTITAGWSRTVARPTFYEFAPAFIVNQATGDITRGNPDLVNSSITNYDLRYDQKINDDTTAGIGLFIKSIEKPIVDAFDPVLSAQSWLNGDSGTLKGIEFETNTLLGNHYRLGANYTYIQSDLVYTLQGLPLTTGFTGQPEHIFNLIGSYELKDQGFTANLIYNFTGEFMAAAPTAATAPSIMQESFETLDFNIQQLVELWNCDVKVTLGVSNILDSPIRQYFSGGGFTFREVRPGRTYNISCQVSF
jgi:hypothetical protein